MEDQGGGGHIYEAPRAHLWRTMVEEDISMEYLGFVCVGP